MTGGTEEGYRKVLAQFYKDAKERLSLLQHMPELDKLPVFVTQVHALKSAAATIGAAEISAEAARLEAAGKAGDMAAIQEHLPGFVTRLMLLTEGIGAVPAAPATPERDTVTSAVIDLTPLLGKLAEALQTKNASAIESTLEEINQKPLDGKTREVLNAVSDDILMTEYSKALKKITELLENK